LLRAGTVDPTMHWPRYCLPRSGKTLKLESGFTPTTSLGLPDGEMVHRKIPSLRSREGGAAQMVQVAQRSRATNVTHAGRSNVRTVQTYFFATLMAFSIAGLATEASAQSKKASNRDAAVTRCLAAVGKMYPADSGEQQGPRTAAYKACMTKAGFRP
jgi:hypothetical protein